jgi:hypothetical protein
MRFLVLLPFAVLAAAAEPVTKTLDRFAADGWSQPPWNKAVGTLKAGDGHLALSVPFAGKGFQFCGLDPAAPLAVPGRALRYELELQGSADYPVALSFTDGWGRTKAAGKDLKHEFKPSGAWQTVAFTVPGDWVQPVRLSGISTHNWNRQEAAATVELRLRRLAVTTDTAGADPASGLPPGWKPSPDKPEARPPAAPLFSARLAGEAQANVFAGCAPSFTVSVRSWLPGRLEGSLAWRATTLEGAALGEGRIPLAVEDLAVLRVQPPAPRFGVHRLATTLEVAGRPPVPAAARYAALPAPVVLTPAEHAASPYGLCVHGGRTPLPDAFSRAGIRWYRDYAFNWEWMKRSEGADRSFTGWPNHRAIADGYLSRGLGLLPVLVDAIPRPAKDAKPGSAPAPDAAWSARLAAILGAFPTITHWELDNEYDLKHAAWEQQDGWAHYRRWHRHFAEALRVLGGGKLVAVENGRAGIFPELVRQAVAAGDFNDLGVVNVHYYCGADAPEASVENRNTGFAGGFAAAAAPAQFTDRLRDTVAAARGDGRRRPVWLTEFGWDDLAGPRVDTAVKIACLPRGFIAALGAGADKAFWFFDLSVEPAKAANFFDGCGLIGHELDPEPALATFAGLTQVLPAPRWLGPIEGPGSLAGALFANRGELVAALWSADGRPATVTVAARAARDACANPLPADRPLALGMAPVYVLGLDAGSPLARQAAYDLASHRFEQVAAGDRCTVRLVARNRGTQPLRSQVRPTLPAGWGCEPATVALTAAPGGEAEAVFTLSVPADAPAGEAAATLAISEADAPVAERRLRIQVVAPLLVEPPRLAGSTLRARVVNRSSVPRSASLALELPAGWSGPAEAIAIAELAPGATRTIEAPVTWRAATPAERPAALLRLPGRADQRLPVLPAQRVLPHAGAITVDAKLEDWPAGALLDAGALGCTSGPAEAVIGAAWHADGLYLAVRTADGGRQTGSPKTFWMADALEVFVAADGRADKRSWRAEDHQFWIVPQFDSGRAYVGRWGHGEATGPTAYDLPAVPSAVRRDGDGYVMELLLPRQLLRGWAPTPGKAISAALTLAVHGRQGAREVYWPVAKEDGIAWQAGLWGGWLPAP